MKTNWNKEEVNGLLDEMFILVMDAPISRGDEQFNAKEQFKLDKGLLLPTLEVGKWYKNGSLFNYQKGIDVYGFNEDGSWCTSTWSWFDDNDPNTVEATHEEVKTALKAEAIKRGYKEGVRTTSLLIGHEKTLVSSLVRVTNWDDTDGFTVNVGSCWVYKNGKWSTIITKPEVNEFTIKELEELTGKTNIKIIK